MKSLKSFARRYYLKHILICVLVELMLFYAPLPVLLANPIPGATALPTGLIDSTGVNAPSVIGSNMTITQTANEAIINWKNFDIGADAAVIFNQANASAYVLNRVNAADKMATGIMGDLIANGGVIVINPRGIVIGPSALINAGKFVASGLGISDADFRNFANGSISVLKFEDNSHSGNVTNSGTINATDAVYLVGKNVTNTGTISCPGGMIVMAAGDKVYLAQSGSNVVVEKLDTGSSPGNNIVRNESTVDADGAGVLLAAGDIYSQATIENARSFVAKADRNLNVDGALENVTGNVNLFSKQSLTIDNSIGVGGNLNLSANQNLNINGDLTVEGDAILYADFDHVDGGDFHSTAPITAGGDIEVRGNDVLFDETVDAGGDLTIVGRDCHPPEWEWGNVTAMKTLDAGGDIKISVTGEKKEWVDGHWEGRTWVDGHWEWHCGHKEWVCGHWDGGLYIPGYWEYSYAPGTIHLYGNVTAGGNLMLCNNTETYNSTGDGVRLEAGRNVILAEDGIANSRQDNCTYLHGRDNLEIVALDGVITNDSSLFDNPDATPSMVGAPRTTISVEGSTLLLEQTPSIDTQDYTFANQNNTHLTLISDNGSVTATTGANAANKWKSIGAHAADNITLAKSGNPTTINLGDSGTAGKSLWAENGYIDIDGYNVKNSDDYADWALEAGTTLSIRVVHGINLGGDLTSDGDMELLADTDTRWGHDVVVAGNINSGGALNIEGTNVDIQTAHSEGDMDIYAHGLYDAGASPEPLVGSGDVRVHGTLTTTDGHIKITAMEFGPGGSTTGPGFDGGTVPYSADGTIYLYNNVTANGGYGDDVLLMSNTVVSDNVKIESTGDDVVLAGGKMLEGLGALTVQAGDDILLGVNADNHRANPEVGSAGNVSAAGNLILKAGDDVYAHGMLTSSGGCIDISSSDSTTYLYDNVTASDDIILHNNTVVKAAGKTLQSTGDDVVLAAGKTLDSDYDLTIVAGDDILLGVNADNHWANPEVGSAGNVSAAGNLILNAGDDVYAHGNLTAGGNIEISSSDSTTYLYGDFVQATGSVLLNNRTELRGTSDQRIEATNGTLTAKEDLDKTTDGDLYLGGQTGINFDGTVDVWVGSLIIEDDFLAAGDLLASENVTFNSSGQLNGLGDQKIEASSGAVYAGGTVTKTTAGQLNVMAGNGITLADDATAVGSMYLDADTDDDGLGDVLAQSSLDATTGDLQVYGKNIQVAGTSNAGKDMKMIAADHITLGGAATAVGNMYLEADEDSDGIGDMWAQSTLTTKTGDIEIYSSDSTTYLCDDVTAGRDVILHNNIWAADGVKLDAARDVTVGEGAADGTTLTGEGALTVEADRHITFGGAVVASDDVDGDLVLWADKDGDSDGDMTAYGTIYNAGGSINIYSSDGTTYLGGDVYAGHNVLLNNNTKVNGYGDQRIEAGNELIAMGFVRKCTPGDMYLVGNSDDSAEVSVDLKSDTSTHQGNLWILGKEDIQISGDVTTFGEGCYEYQVDTLYSDGLTGTGGVAIISENGKIYTDGADGALNVSVTGSSNHKSSDYRERGVYEFGLYTDGGPTMLLETEGDEAVAAIAIVSAEPLKITGSLEARGQYYNDGSVDDRAGIGFLDVDAEIPDGTPREKGEAFDLAIYTASKTSGVEVSGPVMITSGETVEPMPTIAAEIEPRQTDFTGAMVIDAYDIITFGDESSPFRTSLAAGEVGDRLEVCSRITEWLEDAVGRLPFAGDDFELPGGDTFHYVMRGAGLENDQITDGRAWVLESKEKPIEPLRGIAPIQQPELKFTGCPAVMNWVAKELGLEAEQLQIYMDSTLAMSSGVQPCDVCARLKNTALVLMDADETQLKALGQVVNEFAAAGAPPSEEQMAMIATALQNPQEGTQYALAAQWLDALAEYINILNKELKLPADESMALAAKYTAPVTGGDNAALAAYVQVRLAVIGG